MAARNWKLAYLPGLIIVGSVGQVVGEKKELTKVDLIATIMSIVSEHTAGSPTDESVKWTHLHAGEIARLYCQRSGDRISHGTVKRILKEAGFRKRRPSKALATGKSPFRAEQFRMIFYFANLFAGMDHNPILSIDTKKKERLGQLDRSGTVLCQEAPLVHDHDYPHLAEGKVVPHGIYDLKLNKGYLSIGTNNETAAMIGDNLIWWWEEFGIHAYPDAKELLLFCDCGGANGYRHHAFKKELLRVAAYIGIKIVVVHYPPYCSKWNPIEHRLFSQMHRAADGAIFTSYQQVKTIFQTTRTTTGLTLDVRISDTQYQKGLKIGKEQLDHKRILTHPDLPQFNYTILPLSGAA